ncbi:MAG: polyamine aminopropyltransferase [bacterium]|nr:polyamine aminopropyltransferase [bacterium]
MLEFQGGTWYIEMVNPYEANIFRIKRILTSFQTRYQRGEIVDTFSYGKCLVLDGRVQSAELDEFIYHEALVHPAMVSHANPKSILIVGGGEGATLREILKYNTVEEVIMVDIDEELVAICKEYLTSWHNGAFSDPRGKVIYMDARRYLEETRKCFDVIIIDITEPIEGGTACLLFTKEFYDIVKGRLSHFGYVSLQAGTVDYHNLYLHTSIYKTLKQTFRSITSYQTYMPSFNCCWGFIMASNSDIIKISESQIEKRLKERGVTSLRFYDSETHKGLFSLPRNLRNALSTQGRIITDNQPISIN